MIIVNHEVSSSGDKSVIIKKLNYGYLSKDELEAFESLNDGNLHYVTVNEFLVSEFIVFKNTSLELPPKANVINSIYELFNNYNCDYVKLIEEINKEIEYCWYNIYDVFTFEKAPCAASFINWALDFFALNSKYIKSADISNANTYMSKIMYCCDYNKYFDGSHYNWLLNLVRNDVKYLDIIKDQNIKEEIKNILKLDQL